MKYTKLYATALLLFALVFPVLPVTGASQQQQTTQQKKTEPQKKDDKKKGGENEDDQVIKLDTQLVTVPFNVTDKTNRFINDLTKEDIEVLEDNKPQQIFSFEHQTDMALTIAMLIDI